MDRNKAKGMLWGLIVGDAFGSPIQFSGKDSHPWITEMVKCRCSTFRLATGRTMVRWPCVSWTPTSARAATT